VELALGALFAASGSLTHVDLALQAGESLAQELLQMGLAALAERREGTLHVRCERSMYWQRPGAFLGAASSAGYPLSYVMTGEKRHPRRPPRREGEVYRRQVPALGCSVSFRTLDAERDLEVFHRWMNDPRVAAFWELAGTRETHARYLETTLDDPHMHPVIGCFDDEPFGYFELYWAKEDRIAPFYRAHDYDRGLHMLVGEPRFRGPARVSAWLSSLVHFLFLDDPRTEHVVAEPRADNQKMIDYLRQAGFFVQKEFDFPHKRAAMMIVPRETFFVQYGP
jgi:RimJ/RimL family protein N-acetyltransferase